MHQSNVAAALLGSTKGWKNRPVVIVVFLALSLQMKAKTSATLARVANSPMSLVLLLALPASQQQQIVFVEGRSVKIANLATFQFRWGL